MIKVILNRTYVLIGGLMNKENYDILYDLLQELRLELRDIEEKIKYSNRCVKEADIYVKSFLDAEPEDYKIFSPRNAESVYQDEIRKTYSEKSEYEKCRDELENRRKILNDRIENIEEILKNEKYSLRALNIQEEERQRIARDLHDTSLQNLTHLIHKIELCNLYIDKDPVQAKLELSIINRCLRETIEEIRNTIFNLRPMTFDDLGLKAAFETLLENINENQKYKLIKNIENVSCENNLILVTIYRIVQECLNNIEKHAECSTIHFCCKCVGDICILDIEDNGKGFEIKNINEERHFGLSLMKERTEYLNGKIQIDSKIKKGTKIHIEIPLKYYED